LPGILKWHPDIITPMTLSLKEVDHIALLARLDLSQEEKERYQQQLSAILDHVAKLQKLDTGHIEPTSSMLPPHTVLREDEPREGLSTQQALQNAPAAEKNQFRVPPVLD
jgi:aspartyl-tRNA(Asn)/glutamyl-tRNA(Gln) amidotransferase subunit C